jgi:hypothetical protein
VEPQIKLLKPPGLQCVDFQKLVKIYHNSTSVVLSSLETS